MRTAIFKVKNSLVRTIMAISLGAIPGALGRYFIVELTTATIGQDSSYLATFLINITGCFIIAWIYTLTERSNSVYPEIRLAIGTGFCGAYTTCSSYALETVTQLDRGNISIGLIYWVGSPIAGIFAIQLGAIVGSLGNRSTED